MPDLTHAERKAVLATRDRMLAAALAGVDLDSPLHAAGDRLAAMLDDAFDPMDFADEVGLDPCDDDAERLTQIGLGAIAVHAAEHAGWSPPAQVITALAEMDELPYGTVIRLRATIFQHCGYGQWLQPGGHPRVHSLWILQRAAETGAEITVLHIPSEAACTHEAVEPGATWCGRCNADLPTGEARR